MSEVSTFRLYLLRAMYVFVALGLAIFKLGPAILHPQNLSPQDSVIVSVLGAFALLAVVGIRYPLKMLPLPWRTYTRLRQAYAAFITWPADAA
jgi:hypothetical protein